ncbi:LLM class flavin-dependent oxidoreductase [Sphingobium baderi]|uniref:FMN-dependent monooxygenase n=1 Tax=Sphingobium baderi TaxID=1332080 RepID=A0A0S3EWC6_9SPHN|nr:LLM class flavin-dependent oxidoreductase [Sphingobium baderi]ALR19725.1 FMN-dependent monooxygenase [Sphingobium baderi]
MIELATEIRWQDRRFEVPMERILLSERMGYDAVFTAEGYGSDCLTPLAYIAARTSRLKLGTRIMEVTARAPAMAAMSYQTLNHLTGGNRVIAGLGSAAPMACEGFQGRPWGNPVKRMRDFVTLLRQGLNGHPLDHQGEEWSAPYRGPGAQGMEPAAIGLDVMSPTPIVIGASGPQMISLAAEIAEGWMPPGWAPGVMQLFAPLLEQGFAKAGNGKGLDGFSIWAHVDMLVDSDVRRAMLPFKEYVVTWSALQRPFIEARGYKDMADRLAELIAAGSGEDAEARVQAGGNLLEGSLWEEAIAAVPDDYIDDGWLVGPIERIAERAKPWFDCGLTGLVLRYGPQLNHDREAENLDAFTAVAKAAGKAPAGA